MEAIVAVDRNWGIGYDGALLFHISDDLKRFKKRTMGRTVIYGRKTLETFPGGRPLAGRRNIILSRDDTLRVPGAEVCHSPEQAAALIGSPDSGAAGKVFVIGGASVYRAFLPLCAAVHVTRVQAEFPADRYFENLDARPEWFVSEQTELLRENGLAYRFVTYRRRTPQ